MHTDKRVAYTLHTVKYAYTAKILNACAGQQNHSIHTSRRARVSPSLLTMPDTVTSSAHSLRSKLSAGGRILLMLALRKMGSDPWQINWRTSSEGSSRNHGQLSWCTRVYSSKCILQSFREWYIFSSLDNWPAGGGVMHTIQTEYQVLMEQTVKQKHVAICCGLCEWTGAIRSYSINRKLFMVCIKLK